MVTATNPQRETLLSLNTKACSSYDGCHRQVVAAIMQKAGNLDRDDPRVKMYVDLSMELYPGTSLGSKLLKWMQKMKSQSPQTWDEDWRIQSLARNSESRCRTLDSRHDICTT